MTHSRDNRHRNIAAPLIEDLRELLREIQFVLAANENEDLCGLPDGLNICLVVAPGLEVLFQPERIPGGRSLEVGRYREGQHGHRTQAYAISVGALAHINALDLALATTRELMRSQPYDAEVAYTVRYMKDTLEHAGSPEALTLAGEEHAAIVQALSQPGPFKATSGDTTISTGALYASAMELAFLNRFAGNSDAAAAASADVDAALQKLTAISAEDEQEIHHLRAQYQLLGAHLPDVQPTRTLQSTRAKAQIDPNFGAATVLVLFSDWCIECRGLVKTMVKFAIVNRDAPIHVYALLYSEDSPADARDAGKLLHAENEKELAGTPTLEVPAQTAQIFGVVDYPLGVVLDSNGTIRYIGVLPSDAFDGNGYIEKVFGRMFPKNTSKGN
jgi:hypothetical protein